MDALGDRLHDRHAGLPGQPAHRVQGLPVRRRRAAQRQRHARPSADADDRCQPGAGAAGAVPAQGGPDRLQGGRARARRRSRGASTQLRAEGVAHRRRRRGLQRRPAAPRPGARGHAAGDRRFGRGDRPAGQLRPRAVPRPPARCRRADGCAASCPAAARWRPTARCGPSSPPAGRRSRSIRCASRPATTWSREALAWAAPLLPQGPVLVYSTARAASREGGAGPARRRGGRRDGRTHDRRDRARPGRAGRAATGGRRRRDLRRLRAGAGHRARCRSARRSTPACPGAAAATGAGAGLHIALKSGNFGSDDFFTKAFTMLR